MRKSSMIFIVLCVVTYTTFGQSHEPLVEKYRRMALDYNQDLKAAQKNISASIELVKSAKDDLKPKIEGDAYFQFTGNPAELTMNYPSSSSNVLSFQGEQMQYGASISLYQPIYTGGKILESIRLAQQQQSLSENTHDMIRSSVCFQTDVQYWITVASAELTSLYESSYRSIDKLKTIVQERVDEGVADPQDLLMVEVNLNNYHYQLLKSQNDIEINRMALNSLIGNVLDTDIEIESSILPFVETDSVINKIYKDRAEIRIASDKIEIQKRVAKINDSKYKPTLYIGGEGGYYSPGYNFKSDLNPNYNLYTKLSVPIFAWGKRESDKKAYNYKVEMAQDNFNKLYDELILEENRSRMNLSQSLKRVELTNNSLEKAQENEIKAVERYDEGDASVVEVIDAQVYRLTAQINYVQAKLAMQISYSELLKSLNAYSIK